MCGLHEVGGQSAERVRTLLHSEEVDVRQPDPSCPRSGRGRRPPCRARELTMATQRCRAGARSFRLNSDKLSEIMLQGAYYSCRATLLS
jgi:hypothetical protein